MNWIVIILCLLLFPIVVSKPRQRFEILPTEDIEGIEGLLNLEELNSYNLHQYIGKIDGPSSTWMEFLAKYGLIENSRVCEYCPTPMSLIKETDLKAENYIWRCAGCKKDKSSTKVTVKSGSFFEGLHLSVQQVLYAAADWLENPSKKISDVSRDLKIDKNTIVKLHEWFRQMTKQWFYREASRDPNMKLGGPNKVVEIDETLMFRAKYNRGRMLTRRQVWVFGMIERGTSKVIMFRVPKRDSSTLLPIIHKYVRPGTTIVSDGWAAYGGINRMQSAYNHKFVNHKTNFVDPSDRRVHTQSIEATWGVLKRKLKSRFGDPDHRLDGHMFTYMFRRFHEDTMLLNHLIYEMKFFRRDQLPHTDGDFDLDSSDDSGDSSEDDENDISEDDSSEELSDVEDMDDFDEGDSESDHSSDEEELQNQQRWLSDEDEMEFVHRPGPDIVNDIDLHGEIMSLARRAGRELSPTSRSSSPPARSGRLSEYDHVPPTRNGLSGLSESPQRGRGAHAQRRGHGRRAVRTDSLTAATAAATTEATRPSPRRSPVLNRQGRGTHAHRRGRGRRVVRAGSPKSPTTSEEPATTPSPTHSPVLNRQGRGTHAQRRGRGRRVTPRQAPQPQRQSQAREVHRTNGADAGVVTNLEKAPGQDFKF
uniref:DDE_Tnp_IS1595 domain-containing protein n=1 Tax=Caenorhabditis tropicalis TaxID=1561998 RepID=A0A1I7TJA9_9PELO